MGYKKKMASFGKIKFLVMALVLSGGLLAATEMAKTSQENRSSAATNPTFYYLDTTTQTCVATTSYISKAVCDTFKYGSCYVKQADCTNKLKQCTSLGTGSRCQRIWEKCAGKSLSGYNLCPGDSSVACCKSCSSFTNKTDCQAVSSCTWAWTNGAYYSCRNK